MTNEPAKSGFRLTYSTMFDPPPSLHQRFDSALDALDAAIGREHPMIIDGREVRTAAHFEVRSPIDRRRLLGVFQRGDETHAREAVAAAGAAWPGWAATPWPERVRLLRRAAALIEDRVYEISAAVAVEVGKTRMEAIGEVQESADLISWYCDRFEEADGFMRALPDDPLAGWRSRNATRLRPHGVWAIVAPFNFPVALAAGPIGAALVTGNTAVFKVASDTAWSGTLLMEVFRDAGLPPGVVNHVTGDGAIVGAALAEDPGVAGMTFTGWGAFTWADRAAAQHLLMAVAQRGLGRNVPDPGGMADEVSGILLTAMRRSAAAALREHESLVGRHDFDPGNWAVRFSDRMGLLMAGDLTTAVAEVLHAQDIESGFGDAEVMVHMASDPRVLDLMRYAMSDRYHMLRYETGLGQRPLLIE